MNYYITNLLKAIGILALIFIVPFLIIYIIKKFDKWFRKKIEGIIGKRH